MHVPLTIRSHLLEHKEVNKYVVEENPRFTVVDPVVLELFFFFTIPYKEYIHYKCKKKQLKHANKRVYDGKPSKSSTRVKWRLPFDVVEAIFSTPFMSWHHIVHLPHLHTCGNNIQAHEHTKGGERCVPARSSQPACCHLFFEIQCKLLKRKRKRLRRSRK